MKKSKIYIITLVLINIILVSYIIHISNEKKELETTLNLKALEKHTYMQPESLSKNKVPQIRLEVINCNIDELIKFNTILDIVVFGWKEGNSEEMSELGSYMGDYLNELISIREKLVREEEITEKDIINYKHIYAALHKFFAEMGKYGRENNEVNLYYLYELFKDDFKLIRNL